MQIAATDYNLENTSGASSSGQHEDSLEASSSEQDGVLPFVDNLDILDSSDPSPGSQVRSLERCHEH